MENREWYFEFEHRTMQFWIEILDFKKKVQEFSITNDYGNMLNLLKTKADSRSDA